MKTPRQPKPCPKLPKAAVIWGSYYGDNILDSVESGATIVLDPLAEFERKQNKKSPEVTAVIGFIAKDHIVLASDSQTTTPDGVKLSMRKIHRIGFPDKNAALVAIAGVVDGAELFLETFASMATDTPCDEPRAIADCAERAMAKCRKKILDSFRHESLTPEQAIEHLGNRFCQILLGYYHLAHPFLYLLDMHGATAVRSTRDFLAAGSGGSVAGATLKQFDLQSLDNIHAVGIAVYTIEACKRADLHCSGSCQVGQIDMVQNACFVISPTNIKNMEVAAANVYDALGKEMGNKIAKEFRRIPIDLDDLF